MKQLFILFSSFLILCFLSSPLAAQRCLPGMQDVRMIGGSVNGLTGNPDQRAYFFNLSVDHYTKGANRWVWGIEYFHKNSPYKNTHIPVAQFTGEGGFYMHVFSSPSKVFFASAGVSGLAGYETVNWGKRILFDGSRIEERENFIYGTALSLDLENYLLDNLALFVTIRERLLLNSAINSFHFQWGVGLKYLIR